MFFVPQHHGFPEGLAAVDLHVSPRSIRMEPANQQPHVVPPVGIAAAVAHCDFTLARRSAAATLRVRKLHANDQLDGENDKPLLSIVIHWEWEYPLFRQTNESCGGQVKEMFHLPNGWAFPATNYVQ